MPRFTKRGKTLIPPCPAGANRHEPLPEIEFPALKSPRRIVTLRPCHASRHQIRTTDSTMSSVSRCCDWWRCRCWSHSFRSTVMTCSSPTYPATSRCIIGSGHSALMSRMRRFSFSGWCVCFPAFGRGFGLGRICLNFWPHLRERRLWSGIWGSWYSCSR